MHTHAFYRKKKKAHTNTKNFVGSIYIKKKNTHTHRYTSINNFLPSPAFSKKKLKNFSNHKKTQNEKKLKKKHIVVCAATTKKRGMFSAQMHAQQISNFSSSKLLL